MFVEAAANEAVEAASSGLVGEYDLLIVGPGVLGRLVAEKWREVLYKNYLTSFKSVFIFLLIYFYFSIWFYNIYRHVNLYVYEMILDIEY